MSDLLHTKQRSSTCYQGIVAMQNAMREKAREALKTAEEMMK